MLRLILTSSFLTFALGSGCSSLMGPFREDSTDAKLRPYVKDQVYRMSRRELSKYILEDLAENQEWHVHNNALYATDVALTGGAQPPQVEGSPDDEAPVKYHGIREVYVVSKVDDQDGVSQVRIFNSGDNHRLYFRELQLYERIDPEKARVLKERIARENPGIRFDPWVDEKGRL